ncbi:MAG: hypothetical protein IJS52_10995 [Bacilli bacterium]|nr:hypothetical protein [Bacilli bacterium]
MKSPNAGGELGRLFADLIQDDPGKIASPALAKALGVVKNIPMDEENIRSIIDHMSEEQYARYQRNLAAATRKGREEGERIGRERLVAEMVSKGLIDRDVACLSLGVDDAELDRILEKYLGAE